MQNEEQSRQEDSDQENSENNSQNNEQNEQDRESRFKDGDILTFVRVRFPGNAKSFPFLIGKRGFTYGQKVLAMSDRGMTVGYINSFPYEKAFEQSMMPVRSIARTASQEDLEEQRRNIEKENEAEKICLKYIDQYQLDMNLTHVEFIQFGKKAVFYFTAPARVDFRELVKSLVGELKMRIELRQISVRDRTAALGAVGVCGLQTCCSSFLKNYGAVSIKMAKNQNLALIPSKINGVCGQIKCCIKYEDDVYAEKRSKLPKEGSFVQAKNGDRGKITKLHILAEQFEMLTDHGAFRRYSIRQYDPHRTLPDNWSFPERFEHIVNETSDVIGLNEKEQELAQSFVEKDHSALEEIKEMAYDPSIDGPKDDEITAIEEPPQQNNQNSQPQENSHHNHGKRNNRHRGKRHRNSRKRNNKKS